MKRESQPAFVSSSRNRVVQWGTFEMLTEGTYKGRVMKPRRLIQDEKGFTLVEIIAVLVVLGVLAAVAIPKYMDITTQARQKATQGQIAEVKGRLSTAMAGYIITNGASPTTGAALLDYANGITPNTCPSSATTDGDFEFSCSSALKVITITVSKVQTVGISANNTGTYTVP